MRATPELSLTNLGFCGGGGGSGGCGGRCSCGCSGFSSVLISSGYFFRVTQKPGILDCKVYLINTGQ